MNTRRRLADYVLGWERERETNEKTLLERAEALLSAVEPVNPNKRARKAQELSRIMSYAVKDYRYDSPVFYAFQTAAHRLEEKYRD